MNIELTEEQQQAVKQGEAVRIAVPEIGSDLVVLRAEEYETIRELLEEEREKAAWAQVARRAAGRWAQENPF